jgi:hypothetical protein
MIFQYLPNDILNNILEYDGRIKYEKGIYINIISKNDFRYNIIRPIINKKKYIVNSSEFSSTRFYFGFSFDELDYLGLFYEYDWEYINKKQFKICFYNMKDDCNITLTNTFI